MPFRFRDFFGDFVPDSYSYVINIIFFQFTLIRFGKVLVSTTVAIIRLIAKRTQRPFDMINSFSFLKLSHYFFYFLHFLKMMSNDWNIHKMWL